MENTHPLNASPSPEGAPLATATATASPVPNSMDDMLARLDMLPAVGSQLATLPAQSKVDLSKYDDRQKNRIAEIANTVSLSDTSSIMSFGAEPQNRVNAHLDRLLGDLRAHEAGVAGDLTIELSHGLQSINLPRLRRESEGGDWVANSFGRLPLVGPYFSALRHFQVSHKKVVDLMDRIEKKAVAQKAKLAASHAQMDSLVDSTIANIRDLEEYLAAGDVALARFAREFEQRKREAAASRDPLAMAKLRDFSEQATAFETRLLRMHIAYGDAVVSIPEIRLTQEAARIEMFNIMDTLLFDMPRLKRAIIRVASLAQISKAHRDTAARKELARKVGALGSDALQQAYTAAKSSQGDGIDDVALLSAQADKILETIAIGQRLDEENIRKREAAHASLSELKGKLAAGFAASGERLIGPRA